MLKSIDARWFRQFANIAVIVGESALAVSPTKVRIKADGSLMCAVDILVELQLISALEARWPHLEILSEESHPSMPKGEVFASIDSLDGSATYLSGMREWSISAGILSAGKPIAGVVVQPMLRRAFSMSADTEVMSFDYEQRRWSLARPTRQTRPAIGMDISHNSPERYWHEARHLIKTLGVRPVNLPAVHAGIEILCGCVSAWWSYTAHHWDLAAIAVLLEKCGGIAECIDGSPIPWDRIKMPGILLAASREDADVVRRALH